jgi:hypothetical protein
LSDAQDQAPSLDEGALAQIEKMAKVAYGGAIGSLLLLIFGMALPLLGQTLASSTPTVAYVTLAELLIAGYVQERSTIIRCGLVFTAGVGIGLLLGADWLGFMVAAAAYCLVTALRFG